MRDWHRLISDQLDLPDGGNQPIVARWLPAIAGVAVLVLVILAAVFVGSDDKEATDGASAGEFGVAGLTVPDSTMAAVGTDPTAVPIVKTSIDRVLAFGTSGPDVVALQQRLTALSFDPGVDDGLFGDQTQQAVWAFEKLVLATPRANATGHVDNAMWQTMQDPIVIQPRRPGTGTHVEIYLPEQVAAVFTDNRATLVMHISSGTGEQWCETVTLDTDARGNKLDPPVEKPVCGVSTTPGGVFNFTRQVTGVRNGPLGGMYNPVYFNYGIAMHGAINVPLEPASHGCIRMHKTISETFQSFISIGDRVYVWGEDGRQPEDYTARESLPTFNFPDPNATTTTSSTTTTIAPTTTIATTTTQPVVTPTAAPTTAPTPATTTTSVPASVPTTTLPDSTTSTG